MARFECTADNPWTKEKASRANHPDAEEIGDRDYGLGCYCIIYLCPHCGLEFEEEQPQ